MASWVITVRHSHLVSKSLFPPICCSSCQSNGRWRSERAVAVPNRSISCHACLARLELKSGTASGFSDLSMASTILSQVAVGVGVDVLRHMAEMLQGLAPPHHADESTKNENYGSDLRPTIEREHQQARPPKRPGLQKPTSMTQPVQKQHHHGHGGPWTRPTQPSRLKSWPQSSGARPKLPRPEPPVLGHGVAWTGSTWPSRSWMRPRPAVGRPSPAGPT